MKKLFSFLVAAGLIITLNANSQSTGWVMTTDGQVSCRKVSVQGDNVKIVLENGEKKVYPASNVSSYYMDDVLFTKMPLVIKGKKEDVFMEFMKKRDDMSLFRYLDNSSVRYLVYKGEDLSVEIMDGNKDQFEKYFYLQF